MEKLLNGHPQLYHLEKKENTDKTKFINNYKNIKTIYRGKFSKVILCEKDNERFALKKYDKRLLERMRDFGKDENNRMVIKSKFEDFLKELAIIMDIHHKYCLSFEGIITDYNYIYIVNKYFENECILNFDDYFYVLKKEEKTFIPIPVIKYIIKIVLEAFLYLHKEKNICHRDVKPSNILLNKHGEITLADFGESEYMKDKKIKGTKGTFQFMSPELFSKSKSFDGEKVDIWALGITLYTLYFRVVPFKEKKTLCELFDEIQECKISYHENRSHFLSEITKEQYTEGNNMKLQKEDLEFLKGLLNKDWEKRFSIQDALKHQWLKDVDPRHIQKYAMDLYEKRTKQETVTENIK